MNFQYNYLGLHPSQYHAFSEPDSLFDISHYTDTMNVCGRRFNCDSLFRALGLISGIEEPGEEVMPGDFKIYPNYPNPFNPVTTIEYDLPRDSRVKLEIFNILGKRVKTLVDSRQEADFYTVQWNGASQDGNRVGSGLYIYRLKAETLDGKKKFTRVK